MDAAEQARIYTLQQHPHAKARPGVHLNFEGNSTLTCDEVEQLAEQKARETFDGSMRVLSQGQPDSPQMDRGLGLI